MAALAEAWPCHNKVLEPMVPPSRRLLWRVSHTTAAFDFVASSLSSARRGAPPQPPLDHTMSTVTTTTTSDAEVKKRRQANRIVHPNKMSADVIRDRILEIYEERDLNTEEVDLLMEKYKGHEIDLYRAVRTKYPIRAAAQTGDILKIACGFLTVFGLAGLYAYIWGVEENFSLRSLAPPMPFG